MYSHSRYTKLQPIQYNDESIVKNLNISYRTFIENEEGYELEVSCEILNSRARIGGPLYLKLKITNIGGNTISYFKIDINSYSAEDNRTPYYDRYVFWIKEELEVGQSIIKNVVLEVSNKDFDLSNNDLSEIITSSEKDLRKYKNNIPIHDEPESFIINTEFHSKSKLNNEVPNEQFTKVMDEELMDYDNDQTTKTSKSSSVTEDNSKEQESPNIKNIIDYFDNTSKYNSPSANTSTTKISTKSKDISFNDAESIINNVNISNCTKKSICMDQKYNTVISPIYDNFCCKDDTLVINKKKKMKSIFLTNDFDYLISILPSVIHIEFKHKNMKSIPCRQYQFKLCSEYFTGDLLVARPNLIIPINKTPRYTHYNILMLGTSKNGKTSLINSFLTLFNNRVTMISPYLQKLYHENKNYLLYNIKDLLPESLHVRFYDCPLESVNKFKDSRFSYNNLELVLNGIFPYDFPINSTSVDNNEKNNCNKSFQLKRLSFNNLNNLSNSSLTGVSMDGNIKDSATSLKVRPYSCFDNIQLNQILFEKNNELNANNKKSSLSNNMSKIHVTIIPISYKVVNSDEELKFYQKLFRYITQLNIPVMIALTHSDELTQEEIDEYISFLNNSFRSPYIYPISNYSISNNKIKSFEKDRNILRLLCNTVYSAQKTIFEEFNEDNIKKTQTITNKDKTTINTNVVSSTSGLDKNPSSNENKTERDIIYTRRLSNNKTRLDEFLSIHNLLILGNENSNVIDMTKFTKDQLRMIDDVERDHTSTIFENITHIDESYEGDIDVILGFDVSYITNQLALNFVKMIGLSISSQYPLNVNIGGFLYGEKMVNISELICDKSLFDIRLGLMEETNNKQSTSADTLYRALSHCKTLLDSKQQLSKKQHIWLFISECSNDNYHRVQTKKLAETLRSGKYNCEIFCFYLRHSSEAPLPTMVDEFLRSFADLIFIFNYDLECIYNYLTPLCTSSNNNLNPKLYFQFVKILKDSTKIHLLRNHLIGNIPCNIDNLKKMTSLNLNVNQLSSYIPESIGNLVNLTELQLSFNKLSGNIPISIGCLKNLKVLKMSNNQFTGSIPFNIGNLTKLTKLRLENNKLSGSIPESIGNLVNLEKLLLDHNNLNNHIPYSIGNLVKLKSLQLGNNKLIGTIPSTIGNLNQLVYLGLNDNCLEGILPESIINFTKISEFLIQNNEYLSGEIPVEIQSILSKLNIQGTKIKKKKFL